MITLAFDTRLIKKLMMTILKMISIQKFKAESYYLTNIQSNYHINKQCYFKKLENAIKR